MFGLGKKTADSPPFEPWDVLVGLAPSLVEDLAALVGSTEEDLLVSFQVMPYGDRATLSAYGMIEMDRSANGRRRVISVSPAAVDLVNLAAEFLAAADDADDPGVSGVPVRRQRTSLLASAAVPWVHVVSSTDQPSGGLTWRPGVVVDVAEDRVRVRIPLLSAADTEREDGSGVEAPSDDIQIAPQCEIGDVGTRVLLRYESTETPLNLPQAVAVETLADA